MKARNCVSYERKSEVKWQIWRTEKIEEKMGQIKETRGEARSSSLTQVKRGDDNARSHDEIDKKGRKEREKERRKRGTAGKKKLIHCDEVRTGSLSHRNEADLEGRIEAERQGEKDVMN